MSSKSSVNDLRQQSSRNLKNKSFDGSKINKKANTTNFSESEDLDSQSFGNMYFQDEDDMVLDDTRVKNLI